MTTLHKSINSSLAFWLTLAFILLFSQNLYSATVDYLGKKQGLSHSSVNTLLQDSDGILWVGTETKVNWYLGNQFQKLNVSTNEHLNYANAEQLINVTGVFEGLDNDIWFFNEMVGVYRLTKENWQLSSIPIINTPSLVSSRQLKATTLFIDSSKNIYLVSKQGLFLYSPELNTLQLIPLYEEQPDQLELKQSLNIIKISQFSDSEIAIGTDKGLFIFDPKNNSLTPYLPQYFSTKPAGIVKIDGDYIWIITYASVTKINKQSKHIIHHYEVDFPTKRINGFLLQSNGQYWISGLDGVILFSSNHKILQNFNHKKVNTTVANSATYAIQEIKDEVWLTLPGVLGRYDETTRKIEYLIIDPTLQTGNQGSRVSQNSIVPDSSGNLWLGTSNGLAKVSFNRPQFIKYSQQSPYKQPLLPASNSGLSSHLNRAILLDSKNRLWVGSQDKGISRLNRNSGKWQYFNKDLKNQTSLSHNHIRALVEDNNSTIWAGTEGGGLNRFNEHNNSWESFKEGGLNNHIFVLLADEDNRIWVGHGRGLSEFSIKTQQFTYHSPVAKGIAPPMIRSIRRSQDGSLWLGSHSARFGLGKKNTGIGGLFNFNPHTNKWKNYSNDPKTNNSLSNNLLFGIDEDSNGDLWIGTWGGGLNLLKKGTNKFINYTVNHGLTSNVIYSIKVSSQGNIWLSSPDSISKLIPCHVDTKDDLCQPKIENYTQKNGFFDVEFDSESAFKAKSGELFFGGLNGVISFNPASSFPKNNQAPLNTYIYKLTIQGKESFPISEPALSQWIGYSSEVALKANQQPFTFYIANNEFTAPEFNRYQYRINEGSWIDIDPILQQLTFNKLSFGSYDLEIKSSNNNDVWSETPRLIKITIIPPFYQSITAYILYGLSLILSIVFFFFHRQKIYQQKEQKLNHLINARTLELQNKKDQLQEVLLSKQSFLENVAHELRSPLTVIVNTVESLSNEPDKQKNKNKIATLGHNTQRLSHLINQLMSLANDENMRKGKQIVPLLSTCRQVISSLQTNDNPMVLIGDSEIQLVLDEQALETILINLISNAIKYSLPDSNIKITCCQKGSACELIVSNKGNRIEKNQLDKIFEKGERLALHSSIEGQGIGLYVVKQVIKDHNCKIKVISNKQGDIDFIVTFTKECIFSTRLISTSLPIDPKSHDKENIKKAKILIVEDNIDIRNFVVELLQDNYQLETANNGKEALEKLEVFSPNAVLSDVMMPHMDGFELCRAIRSLNNHLKLIPIVLLTAKNDIESQRKGVAAGASDYIGKPFNGSLLKLKLGSLLNSFDEFHQKLTQTAFLKEVANTQATEQEPQFVGQLKVILQKNFFNTSFNVIKMAESMSMDERTLRRKSHLYLSKQPKYLLRDYRLECAYGMLQSGDHINLIANACGFTSVAHFSKCFKDKYQETAKKVQTKLIKKT